jgi:hypothetical protein
MSDVLIISVTGLNKRSIYDSKRLQNLRSPIKSMAISEKMHLSVRTAEMLGNDLKTERARFSNLHFRDDTLSESVEHLYLPEPFRDESR